MRMKVSLVPSTWLVSGSESDHIWITVNGAA